MAHEHVLRPHDFNRPCNQPHASASKSDDKRDDVTVVPNHHGEGAENIDQSPTRQLLFSPAISNSGISQRNSPLSPVAPRITQSPENQSQPVRASLSPDLRGPSASRGPAPEQAAPVSPSSADLDLALRISMGELQGAVSVDGSGGEQGEGGEDVAYAMMLQQQEEQLARLRFVSFISTAIRDHAQATESAPAEAHQEEGDGLQEAEHGEGVEARVMRELGRLVSSEAMQHVEAMLVAGAVTPLEVHHVLRHVLGDSLPEGEGEAEQPEEEEAAGGGVDPDTMSYEELLALGDRIGQVKHPGANMGAVARLPQLAYSPSRCEGSCTICLGPYERGDALTVLPCLHAFHQSCISTWLSGRNACPHCRAKATHTPPPNAAPPVAAAAPSVPSAPSEANR